MQRKFTLVVIIVTLLYSMVLAQEKEDVIVEKVVQGELVSDFILPLNKLMDLAVANSPLLKYYNSDVIISELKIRAEKRDWMTTLGFEGSAKYGMYDNLIITEDLNTESTTSSTVQTRYSVGLTLKIPLSMIADRTNVRQAKAELDKYRYQKENSERELRQLVIVQYNNVLKSDKKVEITNKSYGILNMQMIGVEKDFVSGKIDITEYSRINGIKMSAELKFEESKLELIAAIQILSEIVGKPITIKN